MTKISNTNAYPFDTTLTGDEYVIGTEPTGPPQNQTRNYKLSELKDYVLGYSSYVATLTQSGTNAPVATVMNNDLGTITYERNSAGSYSVLSDGLFTNNKTVVLIGDTNDKANTYLELVNEDEIIIDTTSDSTMTKMSIEIRIYI